MPTGSPTGNPSVGRQPSIAQRWWVVLTMPSGTASRLEGPSYSVVQSATRPGKQAGTVAAGPFTSKPAADTWITSATQGGSIPGGGVIQDIGHALNPSTWLSSIGGGIASGIESGFVNFFKDIWDVVIGPIEVVVGFVIILFTLILYFKNDVTALMNIAARAV